MPTGTITTAAPTVTLPAAIKSPTISVTGTWGGGTLTVSMNGVALQTTYTANFEYIFDTERPVEIKFTLAESTGATLTYNVW